jgi:integrase
MAVRKDRGKTWQVKFQVHGKRYCFVSPHNTRESALAYEAYLRQALSKGEDIVALVKKKKEIKSLPLLFTDFTEKWFNTHVIPNNKVSTHRSKRNALDNHLIPWFGKKSLEMISVLDIEEFKAEKLKRGLLPKTINNLLSVLRKSLTDAEEWGLISKVPKVKWLRVPPSRYRFLTIEESERLLAAAENVFWYAFILCALRTGMRIGEICALDWSDINWDRHTVTIRRAVVEGVMDSPKNNRTRIIPMADDLYVLFYSHRKRTGLIFPGPDGNHMRKSSWPWKALTRACKRASIPVIGWHVLRHTFASHLTAQGVPMKATQMMLGHSTIQMTERYAHLAPSTLESAIAVLPKASEYVNENERNVSRMSASQWSASEKSL